MPPNIWSPYNTRGVRGVMSILCHSISHLLPGRCSSGAHVGLTDGLLTPKTCSAMCCGVFCITVPPRRRDNATAMAIWQEAKQTHMRPSGRASSRLSTRISGLTSCVWSEARKMCCGRGYAAITPSPRARVGADRNISRSPGTHFVLTTIRGQLTRWPTTCAPTRKAGFFPGRVSYSAVLSPMKSIRMIRGSG